MEAVATADIENVGIARDARGPRQQPTGLQPAPDPVDETEALRREVERVVVRRVDALELRCRGARYTSRQDSQRTARNESGLVQYSKSSPTATGSTTPGPQIGQVAGSSANGSPRPRGTGAWERHPRASLETRWTLFEPRLNVRIT